MHKLSNKLNYSVKFAYFDTRGKYYDPLLGDNYFQYADSIANNEHGINFPDYSDFPYDKQFYGFPFDEEGKVLAEYSKFKQNYWDLHFNLEYDYSIHELTFGGSFQKYNLRYFNNFSDVDSENLHRRQLLFLRMAPDLINLMYGTPEFEYSLTGISSINVL